MAVLQKTESRLPAIFVEKQADGNPTYFNAQNAALLGFNMFDSGFCLVSYLPAAVRAVRLTGKLHNHYVMFVDRPSGTNLQYLWRIRYYLEMEGAEGHEIIDHAASVSQGEGRFALDARRMGLSGAQLSRLQKFTVSCEVKEGGKSLTTLRIRHQIAEPFADIAALYADDGAKLAKGGNEKTTYLAADLWRGYFGTPLTWFAPHDEANPPQNATTTWTGAADELPLNHPLAILYARLLKAGRKRSFPKPNQAYYDRLNGDDLELFALNGRNAVGVSATVPHFAAAGLGKIAWQRIGSGVKEKDVFTDYAGLSESERIDLYNLARFPKSSIALSAKVLDKLLGEAEVNNYAHFLGSTGDKAAWRGDRAAALKNDKFVKSLVFEYLHGPQQDIGDMEALLAAIGLAKPLKRTHKHDWAPYVTTILDYEWAEMAALGRIEDAYFARRIVTHHADGRKTVEFRKIGQPDDPKAKRKTRLGQEEYVVIKTKNLRAKTLRFSVVTGNEVLTGTAGDFLDLVTWETERIAPADAAPYERRTQRVRREFRAEVGADRHLKDEFGVDFDNRGEDNLDDLAIAQIGFRRPPLPEDAGDVWATWKANVLGARADHPATLLLEVWLEGEEPGMKLNFGPEDNEAQPLPAETGYRFLNSDDEAHQFWIDAFIPKADAPRVTKAYFARKVVDPAGPDVTFEEAGITPEEVVDSGSWIMGREVYLVVETKNLDPAQIQIYVQSGDELLLGADRVGHPLPVAPVEDGRVPQFVTVQPIAEIDGAPGTYRGEEALEQNRGGGNPYANTGDLVGVAVVRLRLLPQGANGNPDAATFNAWAAAIAGADPAHAHIDLRVGVSVNDRAGDPLYVYHGAERTWEEAGCGASAVFRQRYDIVLEDEDRTELWRQHEEAFTLWNRETYDIYDPDNAFIPHAGGNLPLIGYIENTHSEVADLFFVSYNFIDRHDNERRITDARRTTIQGKSTGRIVGGFRAEPPAVRVETLDYAAMAIPGVDAEESRVYDNGDVITRGTFNGRAFIEYITRNRRTGDPNPLVNLIRMEELDINDGNRANGGVTLRYEFTQTIRTYTRPELYAGFLGALTQSEILVRCIGSCYPDGSSYPSVEHNNGNSVDTGYIDTIPGLGQAEQQTFINAMTAYGFDENMVSCNRGFYANVDPDCRTTIHDTHMHSSDFEDDAVADILNPGP
ncbi:MAG: hypothetical protein AAGN35_27555 [Bacteroidota bacterium]